MVRNLTGKAILAIAPSVATGRFHSLRPRFRSAVAWNLVAAVFNQGSTFLANIFLARLLLRDVFGEYSMAVNTLLSLSILVQFSLGYTASKYLAEFRSVDPLRAGRILALCVVVVAIAACVASAGLFFAAPWLAERWLQAPQLTLPLRIGTGYLLFSAFNGFQVGAMAGLENFRGLAAAGVVSGTIAVILIYAGAVQFGLLGAMAGLSGGAFFRCLCHHFWLQTELRKQRLTCRFNEVGRELSVFWRFALPAVLAGYVYLPVMWFANAELVRHPSGFAEMGLYAACNSIRIVALFLPNVISNVGLTILNHSKGVGDVELYRRVRATNMWTMLVAAVLVASLALFSGHQILRLFGKDFMNGYLVLVLLVSSAIPEALSSAAYQQIQSHAKMWLALWGIIVPWQAVFAVLALLLVPTQGAVGLASAYLTASIVQASLTMFHASHLHDGIGFEPQPNSPVDVKM
jgi:O-antigen/teichoic acid export membrane protein